MQGIAAEVQIMPEQKRQEHRHQGSDLYQKDDDNLYNTYVRVERWISAFFAHPLSQMPAIRRACVE